MGVLPSSSRSRATIQWSSWLGIIVLPAVCLLILAEHFCANYPTVSPLYRTTTISRFFVIYSEDPVQEPCSTQLGLNIETMGHVE